MPSSRSTSLPLAAPAASNTGGGGVRRCALMPAPPQLPPWLLRLALPSPCGAALFAAASTPSGVFGPGGKKAAKSAVDEVKEVQPTDALSDGGCIGGGVSSEVVGALYATAPDGCCCVNCAFACGASGFCGVFGGFEDGRPAVCCTVPVGACFWCEGCVFELSVVSAHCPSDQKSSSAASERNSCDAAVSVPTITAASVSMRPRLSFGSSGGGRCLRCAPFGCLPCVGARARNAASRRACSIEVHSSAVPPHSSISSSRETTDGPLRCGMASFAAVVSDGDSGGEGEAPETRSAELGAGGADTSAV
mmetsp:Transcript_10760/g.23198  ORF Transcript_10760/g.23198 Transcript_10760/m.23198 type:complete len:306 (+) Transcript_10760:705-1622(+)